MEIVSCVLKGNGCWNKRPKKVNTFGSWARGSPADAENVHRPDPNSLCNLETSMVYIVKSNGGSRLIGV
jgi:hypothetical protein